jgi:hypothetical protein
VRNLQNKLLVITLSALASTLMLPAWSNSNTVWKISYLTAFCKKCDVFIAPDEVKAVNENGMELLAKAPQWDAYVINTKAKSVCVVPFRRWYTDRCFLYHTELESTSAKRVVDERSTFLGIPAVHFAVKGTVTDGLWQERDKPIDCVTHYYGTTEIPMTTAQKDLITAWLGMPRTKEFPLYWGRVLPDGSKPDTLKATAISKQKLASTLFVMPANFKKATGIFDVFEHENRDMLDSIADFAASSASTSGKSHK